LPAPAPDQATAPAPGRPPRAVTQAVWLLWISLATGLVELALSMNPFRKPAELQPEAHMTVFGVFASITLIGTAYLVVVHHVRKGRNWARITVLVLVALGVIESLVARRTVEIVPFLLNLLEILLDIAALALLFSNPAAPWFNRPRH
jgi:hypothetical protein